MMLSNEELDVSCYVALGDSITSGYSDGALYYSGQQFSYANILAGHLKELGCETFRQPLMPEHSPGIDPLGNSRLVLKLQNTALKNYELAYLAQQGDMNALSQNVYVAQGPFNNMGVPGAKITTLLAPGFGNPSNGPGNYNPFFTRMASSPSSASILSDSLQLHPTFFSLFIGNNDALAYALSGGTSNSITPLEGTAGTGFEGSLNQIINSLMANGAKGIIATLPSIEFIPYFTCIPYNGAKNQDAFLVNDPATGIHPLEEGDFVLMDVLLDPDKILYLKSERPLPKKYVLTKTEIKKVKDAIIGYNAAIRKVATEKNLALVDIYSLMLTSQPDRVYNSSTYSLDYKRRGVFSLDGLHPNAFGQSIIANEMIRAIRAKYDVDIPPVRTLQFPALHFPV